jgi:hypothetical protein
MEGPTKTVGRRRPATDPVACFWRGHALQRQADKLNPYPRPRGFVVKFKTYEEYERWKKAQANPRLW